MSVFRGAEALDVLASLPAVLLAGFDERRGAAYLVPVCFAISGAGELLIVASGGQLRELLRSGVPLTVSGDVVRPDFSYRTFGASASATELDESQAPLVAAALTERYGALWERLVPEGARSWFRLALSDLQARVQEG